MDLFLIITSFAVSVSCGEINGVSFGYHWFSERKPMMVFKANIQHLAPEAVWYFRPKPMHPKCPIWNFTL